jgi:hypothetical protein
LIIDKDTPGVYKQSGTDTNSVDHALDGYWIDIDFGENVVLRFSVTKYNYDNSYEPFSLDSFLQSIQYNGDIYELKEGTAFLQFEGSITNNNKKKTEIKKIKGKRIRENPYSW